MDVNLTRFMILVVLLKTHYPRAFSLTVTNYRKAYIRIAQSTRHIIWRHLRIRLLTKEGKTFQLTLYSDQTNGGELGRCETALFRRSAFSSSKSNDCWNKTRPTSVLHTEGTPTQTFPHPSFGGRGGGLLMER